MATTAATPARNFVEDHGFLTSREANDGEESPLLSPAFSDIIEDEIRRKSALPVPHIHRKRIAVLIMASICLIEMSMMTMQAPTNAIMEDIICRERFSILPAKSFSRPLTLADDPRCKTPDVQGELAMMRGWQMALDTLPSILCAVPYGLMADRAGRKPVMILAFLGLLLSVIWQVGVLLLSSRGIVPLWTIYFSSLCTFIGAFSCTGPAMLYTILGEVALPAERAAIFFRLSVAFLIGELIGGPLAGALMGLGGPWLPISVAMVGSIISFCMLFFVPETLARRGDDDGNRNRQHQQPTTIKSIVAILTTSLGELWSFIVENRHLLSLTLPLAFFVLGRMVQDALLQYATRRYGISWSSASVLMAARTASTLVLFVVVFPWISRVLTTKYRMPTPAKDLLMARWTGVVGAAGSFLVALSSTPALLAVSLAVFSVGTGFAPVLRSLLNTLVEQRHLAMVNSLVSFLELLGALVAGPVLSKALSVGMGMGGVWVGLPFFAAGLSLSLSAFLVWVYRLPKAVLSVGSEAPGGGGGHRC